MPFVQAQRRPVIHPDLQQHAPGPLGASLVDQCGQQPRGDALPLTIAFHADGHQFGVVPVIQNPAYPWMAVWSASSTASR